MIGGWSTARDIFMTRLPLQATVQHLRKLVGFQSADEVGDARLLQRFVADSDAGAFQTLVHRHSNLVYGVCRRVLGQDQDAEDAFQATFLILARKAASISKGESLASWLHGVAFRTALSARKSVMRRRKYEEKSGAPNAPRMPESPVTAAALRELQTLLDEEVQSLPERYRAPFILCCWEGRSRAEAAQELGWKEGTVSSRLAHARLLLQKRLARRGVTLSAALSALMLAPDTTVAAGPLAEKTAAAVLAVESGSAAGAMSAHARTLATGVLHAMSKAAMKTTGLFCLAALLISVAIGGMVHATLNLGQAADKAQAPQDTAKPEVATGEKMPVMFDDLLNEAAAIIRTTPNAAFVLEEIAVAQAKGGNKEAASKTFAEVIDRLKNAVLAAEPPHQTAMVLASLARAQYLSGDTTNAKNSFGHAADLARSIKNDNGRADAFQLIARLQAECGDATGARQAAKDIQPEFYKGQVLADIALAQAKAGDVNGAIGHGSALDDAFHRALFWLGLAEWQAATNHADAKKALDTARRAIDQIKDAGHKPGLLVKLALLEGRLISSAAARKTYETARALAQREKGGVMTQESFLLQLAAVQASRAEREGEREEAKKTLDEALRASGKDGGFDVVAVRIALGEWRTAFRLIHAAPWNEHLRAEQLRHLAESQAKSGDAGGAYAWAAKESEPRLKALALLGVAQGMLQGKPAKAVQKGPTEEDIRNRPNPLADHSGEYRTLHDEWETSAADLEDWQTRRPLGRMVTQGELNTAFAGRFLDLARKYPEEVLAIEAIQMAVFLDVSGKHDEAAARILETVLDKNPTRWAQGMACLSLGRLLKEQADKARLLAAAKATGDLKWFDDHWDKDYVKKLKAADPEKLEKKAEKYYERIVAQYAEIKDGDTLLGDRAKAALFEIRELRVGDVAPDIKGEDIDGQEFKLSYYRGKVVVLVFSGHWCAACRGMYPRERELIKEFAGQSFVLLGVNSDEDRAKVKDLKTKGEVTWRNWWDGGSARGPIAKSWNVSAWPMVYVIDSNGVIRQRGNSDDGVASMVRTLLKNAR
jgi:RNA polymerase sigma factor (sigma-70 family)